MVAHNLANKTKRCCFSSKVWFQSGFCVLAVGSRLNGLKSCFFRISNFLVGCTHEKGKQNSESVVSLVWPLLRRGADWRGHCSTCVFYSETHSRWNLQRQAMPSRGHDANCIHDSRRWYLWALWRRRSKSLPSIILPVQLRGTNVQFRLSRCRVGA